MIKTDTTMLGAVCLCAAYQRWKKVQPRMKRWGWKRVCLTVIAVAAALALLAGAALAAAVFTVDTSVRRTVYAPGDTVNIDVALSLAEGQNTAELGGIQLALTYDSTLFTYAGIDPSSSVDFIANDADDVPPEGAEVNSFLVAHDDGAGTVQLVYVNAALTPKNASETLFTVNFTVKADAAPGSTGSFAVRSEGAYSTAAQLVTGTGVTGETFTVTVQESTGLLGDVNGDGTIDVTDGAFVFQHIVGIITLDSAQTACADVDGSGVIDVTDAALIMQYVVGIVTAFPAA